MGLIGSFLVSVSLSSFLSFLFSAPTHRIVDDTVMVLEDDYC